MESITINGKNLDVQGIKELKPGMSVQEASTKTKKNGIDEIYFNVDGKNFLAYGDSLKIGDLSDNKIASVTYNGRAGSVVAYENEINSLQEGMTTGALSGIKKTKDALFGAVSNTITSVGPTASYALAGGAIGLTGLALWRGTTLASVVGSVGVAGSSPLGNILGDVLKNGSIGALKVITVAGAIGFGVTALAGAIGGMSEAKSTEKDYSTIASVTKDGTEGGPYVAPTTPIITDTNNATTPVQSPSIGIFSRPNNTAAVANFGAVSGYLNSR